MEDNSTFTNSQQPTANSQQPTANSQQPTANSQQPATIFAQHAQIDHQSKRVVNRFFTIQTLFNGGLTILALLFLAGLVFPVWQKEGWFSALLVIAIGGFFLFIIWIAALWVAHIFIFLPWKAVEFRLCTKKMTDAMHSFGLNPNISYAHHDPTPEIIALDMQHGVLYINAASSGYERLFLAGSDILEAKVERESEIHTSTTHSGSSIGGSYSGSSKSVSVVQETAFLEIHYQRPQDGAPNWVAIFFGENRRDADSMLAAIKRLQNT